MTGWLVVFLAGLASPVVAAPSVDAAIRPAVVTMPRIIAGGIVTADYPRLARRNDLSGVTRAALTVSRKGRVTRCAIARSSGHAILDAQTCRIAVARMRLSPALDAAGKPVEADVVLPVVWVLEERPTPTR